MKTSIKAALLSAFLFPGAGHFFLKKYISSIILAGTTCAGVYYIAAKTVEKAYQIIDELQIGGARADVATITQLVEKQSIGADAQLINLATTAIIICWIISIVDSYRVGSLLDKIS